MTEEREGPVHYQISITGRQAGTFFFVLLFALGLSFFFGMKTGAAARRGNEAVKMASGTASSPAGGDFSSPEKGSEGEAGKPVDSGEKKLGFEESRSPRKGSSGAPISPTDEKTPFPAPAKATKHSPLALAVHPGPVPTKAASKKEASKEPGKKEPSRKEPVKKETPKTPLYVQVFATTNPQAADDLAKRLKDDGFAADVSLVPNKPGLFRVRVGPYPDKAKAEAAGKKILDKEPLLKGRPVIGP